MRQPKVSVGITVKNSAGTIFECIESIMKSSYPIYEIVVVDAFSTDGTWEILKSFGKRVRALQKKGNVSVGRNEIIKKAKAILLANKINKVKNTPKIIEFMMKLLSLFFFRILRDINGAKTPIKFIADHI